jgi:ABC-type Fe3+/spermidine/putrescine transport system ATPase subunit
MALLVAHGLTKRYGPVVALGGIDLAVEAGEFVTLLGPSGSGKTTLLMAIAGFTTPDDGRIFLDGREITRLDPEDRDFGFVFQGYALFPHLSVVENIAFPLRVRKWEAPRIKARVDEMLALVDLAHLGKRRPRELSGGQQQRVALARALAFGPKVLLLDEPLSALDRTLRDLMQRELKRLHRETGVTFLYVTHDQEEAIAMSDRIAVFNKGEIVQLGAPRDLYRRPASRFVAGFLGSNNILTATIEPDGALSLLGARMPPIAGVATSGTATLFVRPEDIRLDRPAEPALAFSGTLTEVFFVGAFERLVIRAADGQDLIATVPPVGGLEPGMTVEVYLPLSAIGSLPPEP